MPGDVPLLDRLAQLTPVPAAEAASLVERLDEPNADPVIGPLFGTDEEGDTVVNPLVPAVLQALAQKEGLTCYAALLEGLTGIWNAAVRAAVVDRLRAAGLPQDDLLLRLQKLSPTLGFAADAQRPAVHVEEQVVTHRTYFRVGLISRAPPRGRPTILPSRKMVAPRTIVRRTTPLNSRPTYGLSLCRSSRSSRRSV